MDGVDGTDSVSSIKFAICLEELYVFFGEVRVERCVAGILVGAEAFETKGFLLVGSRMGLWPLVGVRAIIFGLLQSFHSIIGIGRACLKHKLRFAFQPIPAIRRSSLLI